MLLLLALAIPAAAQEPSMIDQLQAEIRALREKVAALEQSQPSNALDEVKRQIEVLTQEIEALKVQQQPTASADTEEYGLGAAASKVYRTDQGISFGGYGEFVYENYASSRDDDQDSGRSDQLDALRAILYAGYKFNDRVIFNSEIEVEHGSTGAGGEASLEFGYLDFMIRPEFNVRAGMMLMPSGLLNELHEPTAFLGAKRPDVERTVIPSTWREPGVGIFGEVGPVTYRTYLVTGLRSDRFSSSGIRSGRQSGGKALAEDLALIARADWNVADGVLVGGSYYRGDSAQSKTTPAGASFDATVAIAELHADLRLRGFQARALWADGSIGDAAAINAANNLTGKNSVGDEFGGWYAEAGYDLDTLLSWNEVSLVPFIRYETLDTQKRVPTGFARNPERELSNVTAGISIKPIPQAVIKVDFQNYDNEAGTGVDQWNVGLGYVF
jgi:hypothetical protein